MTPELFIQHLQHPENLGTEDLARLEKILLAYPCFSAARELYLKLLHQSGDLSYESQLFKTSLASPNRARLFAFIHDRQWPLPADAAHFPEDTSGQDFSLIDSFLGAEMSSVDTPVSTEAALMSLQKLYAGYDLGESFSLANAEVSEEDSVVFESPEIQRFIDCPQEEIPMVSEQGSDFAATDAKPGAFAEAVESAWESLPTDSLTLTLVKIYLRQKKYERALEILKALSLNNPEKSVYFADQIRFLEKLLTHLNK